MNNAHKLSKHDAMVRQLLEEPGQLLTLEDQSAMYLLRLIAAAGLAVTVLGLALSLAA